MYSESRKAQHNSFAHHRAALLFSKITVTDQRRKDWSAASDQGDSPADRTQSLKRRVTAGILGFVPAAVAPAR